jgi:histidine kinase
MEKNIFAPTPTVENKILAATYQVVALLAENKNFIFYKAINLEDNSAVTLKVVAASQPSDTEIAHITTEYELLKNLNIAGVPKAIALKWDHSKPILVLEHLGDQSLSEWAAKKPLNLKPFLETALGISTILGAIHEQNITHKNINPKSILINHLYKRLVIIDFGLATKLGREKQFGQNLQILEGNLPYISPEQTGRMNRSIDYRTDLYSLGFCFYDLLTGSAPFESDDIMEMIHFHIAKNIDPRPLEKLGIPPTLIAILLKLTDKIPDDRYQSVRGLMVDLKKCLQFVQNKTKIIDFQLGSEDLSLDFRIPEHLYGRNAEMTQLLSAYEQAAAGENVLMMIDGSSGIGKSALVHEIHKQNVKQKGYFIAGKFDQFKAKIPFYAFSKAFSELLRQIVSEPPAKMEAYKAALRKALGTNTSVLVDLIPSFEVMLGKQNPTAPLNPLEAQNRFFFTLRDFIKVFATKEHPLIIFLDDLQWCDDASLLFLKDLVTQKVPYLFLIGAYRGNETPIGHPLLLTMDALQASKRMQTMVLNPLQEAHVQKMVADTLHAPEMETQLLGNIVFKNTAGNPFYVIEFLKNIHSEGFIKMDHRKGKWVYNLNKIAQLKVYENVVEMLSQKLKELPDSCRTELQMAACLGDTFELKSLAALLEKPAMEVSNHLWPAIKAEIIVPLSENYRFVSGNQDFGVAYKFQHDKIQQAVYESIDDATKTQFHYKIGKYLTKSSENLDDKVIEIVMHLNQARNLIQSEAEATELAHWNAKAGHKAQTAIAYQAAMQYYKNGMSLLPSNHWKTQYDLAFDLNYGFAKNAYQIGEIVEAERCIDNFFSNITNKLDHVKILSLRLRQYSTLGKTEEGIQQGIKGLALLGVKLPEKPSAASVLKEVLEAKWRLRGIEPNTLLERPVMSDPEKIAAARLLTEIGPSAYILGNDNLYALTSLKLVNLSLQYGNCPESSFAYITYAAVLGEAFGDYVSAEKFGKFAVELNLQLHNIEYRCRVRTAYGVLLYYFSHSWVELSDWHKKSIEAGYQSGDLFFLAFSSVYCAIWNPALNLATSYQEQIKYLKIIQETRHWDAYNSGLVFLQSTQNWRNLTKSRFSLNDDTFDETEYLQKVMQRKYASGLGMYYIAKAEIHLIYDDFETALQFVKQAEPYKKSLVSSVHLVQLCKIHFFTVSSLLDEARGFQKWKLKQQFASTRKLWRKWANFNPVNFLHIQLLMDAELESHQNQVKNANALYEQSFKLAQTNGWRADAAFTLERYAKHCLKNNMSLVATECLLQSIALYQEWGATRKALFLQEKYATLLSLKTTNHLNTNILESKNVKHSMEKFDMDMASIIKTSQAISGEIVIESLLSKMIQIIVMNVGAENGVLLLENNDNLYIQATSYNQEVRIMPNILLKNYAQIPQYLVNYVSQMREAVVLNNASVDEQFKKDAYISSGQIKSVLCSPIILLNKLYGIIYLENNILTNAFTEERLKVLNLLSSQMAISIQNALHYANLEEKVALRTAELSTSLQQLKSAQLQLVQSEKMASLGELTAGIAHEINNPINFVASSLQPLKRNLDALKTLIDKYDDYAEQPSADKLQKIVDYKEEIDYDYTKDEIEMLLGSISDGANRTTEIVKGLRNFSRLDEADRKKASLNEGIESTLLILQSNLKQKNIRLIKLLSEIPEIQCYAGQLNQVFMNILNNAIQSMPQQGTLTVKTFLDAQDNLLKIAISDTGSGIPAAILSKIFDPFFTTKQVGDGTGLGLSISYGIVKKHNGTIEVESEMGKGSTFVVQLPIE